MKLTSMLFVISTLVLALSSAAFAADFDWVKNFNIRAEADPSGFRAQIAGRFKIGDAEIDAVLRVCDKPADAYIVLRLGEMSRQPTQYVLEQYKVSKGKGWGVLAKNLGIKPGSKEFHELKRSQDLYDDVGKGKGKAKGKGAASK